MPHQASQDDCASANEVRSPKAWYAHPSRHCTGLLPASTAGADLPSAIANSRAEPQPRCGIACHELDTQTSAKDRTPLGATLGRARPSTRPVTSHMARALAHPRLGGVRCPPRTAASPTPPAEHSHRQLLRLQFIFNSSARASWPFVHSPNRRDARDSFAGRGLLCRALWLSALCRATPAAPKPSGLAPGLAPVGVFARRTSLPLTFRISPRQPLSSKFPNPSCFDTPKTN